MITQELEASIHYARRDAARRGLATLTVEHLALALLENPAVRSFLSSSRADVELLRKNLSHFLRAKVPRGQQPPSPSEGFQRVLRRALQNGKTRERITGVHVLAAIFSEPDSFAAYYMKKSGIERLTVIAHLADGGAEAETEASPAQTALGEGEGENETEWVALARRGLLEAPFGRRAETDALMRILARKYKNNPLLVGLPGVGKTAVVRALAHRFAAGDAPDAFAAARIVPAAMGEMIAGTKYRGDFEQRLRNLLDICRKRPGTVLFIDEIHTLAGAGAVSGGALDAANIVKPMLDDDALRCIGATTETDYARIFERDSALSRRFQKTVVAEPQGEELRAMLDGAQKRLAQHHRLQYEAGAVEETVRLAKRFLPARNFPDKGIDILDDAAARRRLSAATNGNSPSGGNNDNSPSGGNNDSKVKTVRREDIADAVADAAGLPSSVVRADEKKRLAELEEKLGERVLDQPEAVRRLCGAVLRARLGYHDGKRAAGAFLFAGPTGVGKTETARQLADLLALPLLRYDMSEYMEAHSAAKLIGAPPGYVGYEERGRLTGDIAAHPGAVVLFDEIDKAHPDVLGVLLQIMDYAALTDSGGRRADFSHALIVLTTNAGAREWQKSEAGYARADSAAAAEDAIARLCAPEFLNRLDAVVRFRPLPAKTVQKILGRQLREMLAEIRKNKGMRVTVSAALRKSLRADGFSPKEGARPLQRLLRERVLEPLAQAEANNALPKTCLLDWQNNAVTINNQPPPANK